MRRSLWEKRATGAHPYAPLAGSADADVVVVGAGIAGLTTAALLVREGRRVIVLEALEIAAGTTGRTTAKVSALQGLRYRTIIEHHGADAARSYAEAQIAGLAWMAGEAQTDGRGLAEWEWRPAVTYATTSGGRRALTEELEAARSSGLPVDWADSADLPFETTGALVLDRQGQVDPVAFLHSLANQITSSTTGTIHEHSRVTNVRGLGPHEVHTDRGSVRADHVVIATLLPIVDRGLFFARAKPVTSYLVALETEGPVPRGMYLSADEPTRSLRAVGGGENDELLLVGGEGHPTGRRTRTDRCSDELVAWASEHFGVRKVHATWSAHDYVPADHLPWVGSSSPLTPNVVVAAGFEKWGMSMGTAAALILRDQIVGRTDGLSADFARIFSPACVTPHGLLEAAKLNGGVATEMLASWADPARGMPSDSPVDIGRRGLLPVAHRQSIHDGNQAEDRQDLTIVCTHLGGVCRWNRGDDTWDCPLHGSRFTADGAVLTGPTTRRLPSSHAGDEPAR